MADVHPASKDQTHGNRRVGDSMRVTEWSLAEPPNAPAAVRAFRNSLCGRSHWGFILDRCPRRPCSRNCSPRVPLGAQVVTIDDDADLPFPAGFFDLVVSRHPVQTRRDEIAGPRARRTFLSQQVGAGSVAELTEAMMGPQEPGQERSARRAAHRAEVAGLVVTDLRCATPRMEFHDIAAVVVFLHRARPAVPHRSTQTRLTTDVTPPLRMAPSALRAAYAPPAAGHRQLAS